MVPIHDTDLAEDRWTKSEWENYELWEKVEYRFRRQRRLWIMGAVALFLALSAVPILVDRWPKWTSRALARHLALEINTLKRLASSTRSAYQLEFVGPLVFQVKKFDSCAAAESGGKGELVKSEILRTRLLSYFHSAGSEPEYTLIPTEEGKRLEIPGLLRSFCYDPLQGSAVALKSEGPLGFAFAYAKDLTEERLDRMSILLLDGPSAEISFD